ncbi:class I SAM-dependent methyltransferase [Qipengyuania marisflavi]|uniref:Class I SAM-dependent methyltransferase n=1 Tax=Qipengyuania marisflavi TaxID=2486356 RepID=A0A5S3P1F4_9SPHN|nr:class I SAM-dependent methyltransferase [Qipengyuania marisflavi]TMM46588.1 class I SAM-dependent methyltransferase [Qipengyuania marisflavi]
MDHSIYQSGEYLENNPEWHAEDAPLKAQWVTSILKQHGVEPKSIVEIGCGVGELLRRVSTEFPAAKVDGYEISAQAYPVAKEREQGALAYHFGDYLELAENGKVERPDVAMAIDVFEHVEDYIGFLKRMRPLAEWKLFHIPLDLSVQAMLRGATLNTREKLGHLHYFEKKTALATLEDCGYEVVGWNYTHGSEQQPRTSFNKRIMKFPRRIMRMISPDLSVRVLGGSSLMVLTK